MVGKEEAGRTDLSVLENEERIPWDSAKYLF